MGVTKGCSPDVRKQMVQRVDGRLRVRGGVIMVRQNKAFLDHVSSLLFAGAACRAAPASMSILCLCVCVSVCLCVCLSV